MTEHTYVNQDGVENVACAIISQARKDFIKGGKTLYGIMHNIPTYHDLLQDPKHASLSNNADVRWMYDAWRFVQNDPYDLFSAGEDTVINAWKEASIYEYHKDMYIRGASILYANKVSKQDIASNDDVIRNVLNDNLLANGFIVARNYAKSLHNKDKVLHEWNVNAYARSRNVRRGCGRIPINETAYNKQLSEKKRKNISKAKELFEAGFSPRAIAAELGVTIQSARLYLRS